jgi:hypothetical protein
LTDVPQEQVGRPADRRLSASQRLAPKGHVAVKAIRPIVQEVGSLGVGIDHLGD